MFAKSTLFFCLLATAYATQPHLGLRSPRFGVPPFASRIVGGSNAVLGEFPHMVSVQWGLPPLLPLSHICGGSILNERWILTSAQCPQSVTSGDLYIKAGKLNLNSIEITEQTVVVDAVFIHEQYSVNVIVDDIALLRLPSPLTFSTLVSAISLPSLNSIPEGDSILSGWGSTVTIEIPIMPNTLQMLEIPIIGLSDCEDAIEEQVGPSPLAETNICTGPLTGGQGACIGDVGSPLIQLNAQSEPEVIGIVSWSLFPCGLSGVPTVYTRVSAYNNWINSVITANS